MTKAVFAGEQVEEFAFEQAPAELALFRAPLARFPKHFLMSHRPCDTRNRNREVEKSDDLRPDAIPRHRIVDANWPTLVPAALLNLLEHLQASLGPRP